MIHFIPLRKEFSMLKRFSLNENQSVITDHLSNVTIQVIVNPNTLIFQGVHQIFHFRGNVFILLCQGKDCPAHTIKRAFKWYRSQVIVPILK